jgi:hypothetical protein
MTKRNLYKLTDLAIQLSCIILPWSYFAMQPAGMRGLVLNQLIVSYLIIAASQIVSSVLNKMYMPVALKANSRKWYELALMVVAAMVVIAGAMNALMLVFLILLYLSPVLMLWYMVITIAELIKIRKA